MESPYVCVYVYFKVCVRVFFVCVLMCVIRKILPHPKKIEYTYVCVYM